jgi:predicted enzyme related to lactoylglutathione lyase
MDKVVHFEIPVDDVDRAKAFYGSVFGWELPDYPGMDYTGAITTPMGEDHMPLEKGAINGGIMRRNADAPNPLITIQVDSIDDHLGTISGAGGKVIKGRTEVPNMGWFAYVADTEGNVVGLWENMS